MSKEKNVLDGNIGFNAVRQIKQILRDNPKMTVNSFAKGSGVNHQILQRIIDGEATKQTTLDKLGVYIIENKL